MSYLSIILFEIFLCHFRFCLKFTSNIYKRFVSFVNQTFASFVYPNSKPKHCYAIGLVNRVNFLILSWKLVFPMNSFLQLSCIAYPFVSGHSRRSVVNHLNLPHPSWMNKQLINNLKTDRLSGAKWPPKVISFKRFLVQVLICIE